MTKSEIEPADLVIRGLAARYGPKQVLHDVDLSIRPSECLALVGESGSGKTTLARCIVGLHSNWSGDVRYGKVGVPQGIRRRPLSLLQQIQFIFQNPYSSLNPRRTIGQIVEHALVDFFSLSVSDRRRRVVEILEEVSLGSEFLGRYPDQLSGGERQRVAVARALVVEPRLLVCDEVTSSLDVSVQATVIELLLQERRKRNLAMLFITHNIALVPSIAQNIAVLYQGRIVEYGSATEVLASPSDSYTAQLLRDVPTLSHL